VFIYNVTVNVSEEIHEEWKSWMRLVHMPDVMRTGCFVDSQLLKLLYVEDEGHTYSVQYRFLETQDIENYQKNFASALQAEHKAKFGDRAIAFRTLLQVVE
jgi:hypothetical protein